MQPTTIVIPPELSAPAESSLFEGSYSLECLKAGPDLYTFDAPLNWNVTVTNTGGALLVAGTVEGAARTSCVRCLEPFDLELTGEIEGYFLLSDEEAPVDDLEEDEFDVMGPDNTIDLIPLMHSALLMDVPLVPLCRDDCKGLCPDCGINLNEGTCDCASKRAAAEEAEEKASNPFSVLKDLDLGEDEGGAKK